MASLEAMILVRINKAAANVRDAEKVLRQAQQLAKNSVDVTYHIQDAQEIVEQLMQKLAIIQNELDV